MDKGYKLFTYTWVLHSFGLHIRCCKGHSSVQRQSLRLGQCCKIPQALSNDAVWKETIRQCVFFHCQHDGNREKLWETKKLHLHMYLLWMYVRSTVYQIYVILYLTWVGLWFYSQKGHFDPLLIKDMAHPSLLLQGSSWTIWLNNEQIHQNKTGRK
jgi:hypothetical protein